MENKLEHELIGSPYFIRSSDEENFDVVKTVFSNQREGSWSYSFDEQEKLILGRDIMEVPTRGLILAIENPMVQKNGIDIALSFIGECRKFAKLSLCDYFSTELTNGKYISQGINNRYSIVRPRLFRKIIDN